MTELTEAIRNYLPSDDRETADKVAFCGFWKPLAKRRMTGKILSGM